jgi:flotillin
MDLIQIVFAGVGILFLVIVIATCLGRFKMCPPDKVLVVFGKTGSGQSSQCINGGAKFIVPIFQSYGFMSLRPLNIKIELEDALSSQKIRVSVPSNFTIAISKKPELMMAAANRLLGKSDDDISQLAQEIITGQMRIVIATMTIEEINSDREKLIGGISTGVERELEKLGLELINCNITDIQDKSGYIDALGKEAAAKAINDAQIRVAQENQRGTIGQAEAVRDQKIKVAEAEALQTVGQNKAQMDIADSNAALAKRQAEASKVAQSAKLVADAEAVGAGYAAQKMAEDVRATREQASLSATEVSRANVDKQKAIVNAEAVAAVARTEAEGRAAAILTTATAEGKATQARLEGEAAGQKALLLGKAEGFKELVAASTGPEAISLIVAQQLTDIVRLTSDSVAKLRIDKIVVMDGGSGSGPAGVEKLVENLFKGTIPIREIMNSLGVKLPGLLGTEVATTTPAAPPPAKPAGGPSAPKTS